MFVGLFERVSLDFFGDMSFDEVLVLFEFFFIVVDILDYKLLVKFVVIGVVYNYLLCNWIILDGVIGLMRLFLLVGV